MLWMHSIADRGTLVNINRDPVVRYDEKQVQHFVDFFLSPHITNDMPFGEKKLKLSSGETLIVANTIRNAISTRIITQYRMYCDETQFKLLSDTILHDILKHCTASTCKSLSGLDTYSANGSSSFTASINLCDVLNNYGKRFFVRELLTEMSCSI